MMKKRKIPIIFAAAFLSMMTAGCGEQIGSTEISPGETTTAETSASTTAITAATAATTAPQTTATEIVTTAASTETTEPPEVTEITEITGEDEPAETTAAGLLSSADELELTDLNGEGWDFEFVYDGQTHEAYYTAQPESWTIVDSYLIRSHGDMEIICEALTELHPLHGSDYESYRTPKDMVYEWEQHNLAYRILPKGNSWRENAKNVDFDPEDQGKSLYELYKARTGKSLLGII